MRYRNVIAIGPTAVCYARRNGSSIRGFTKCPELSLTCLHTPFPCHSAKMTSMFSSHSDALRLNVEDRPYVSGERIAGFVDVDIRRALEEDIESIKVKLRGNAVA
jgi:hypothetical protein